MTRVLYPERVIYRPAGEGHLYLSGAGRLVVKDAIMMGAALVTMADSARAYLMRPHAAVRLARERSVQEAVAV